MEGKKLNLGCGEFKKPGFVNVDFFALSEPDVRHDLNRMPYPFSANTFSLIEADHVLEHLNDPFAVLREIHRIACHGAIVRIRVPHFSRGFTHPQHARGFDITLRYYFDPLFQGGYQGVQFKQRHVRFRWFAQPYLKKQVLPQVLFYGGCLIGACCDALANLCPVLCSRLWCFWVGGFEELEFEFVVIK